MTQLMQDFSDRIFTFDFLWLVIAVVLTMEVMKWTVLPKGMSSRLYPVITFGVCILWVLLKTTFTGDWREWLANFLFTVLMADLMYTYAGQYVIKFLIWGFRQVVGGQHEASIYNTPLKKNYKDEDETPGDA